MSEHAAESHAAPVVGPGKRTKGLDRVSLYRLDRACQPIAEAFDHVYLVGSSTTSTDWRDIDVRIMLPDDRFRRRSLDEWSLFGIALTVWLRQVTGLPVDCQFQRMSNANAVYGGQHRNSLGRRRLGSDMRGDMVPLPPGSVKCSCGHGIWAHDDEICMVNECACQLAWFEVENSGTPPDDGRA